MFLKYKVFSVFFVVFSVAGCMSMPISTMYKMSQFSPFDMEPKEVRVAVRTDEQIQVRNGAVKISMSYRSDGTNTLPAIHEEHNFNVQVQQAEDADLVEILLDDIEENERVTILKLSEGDAQNMKNLLQLAKQYKAVEAKGTGEFAITTNNDCFENINKFESLDVDVFFKTSDQEGYMLFLEDVDIIEQAKDNDIDLKQTNKCEFN
ncbi:hypothetical protein [Aliiglaciecola lipolytica]|uniref:Lipoprotein n=1 Tax=Aliiglaciecola lipolytica E3 TaxID=1127673 RepID=K6YE26_9ALTE|nr:hypothetical protein [Aliiglaciecola lipolytica]GAC14873.1 hypothetical protein GLIP_2245 [Aliiglaciecola lipolytica E3]